MAQLPGKGIAGRWAASLNRYLWIVLGIIWVGLIAVAWRTPGVWRAVAAGSAVATATVLVAVGVTLAWRRQRFGRVFEPRDGEAAPVAPTQPAAGDIVVRAVVVALLVAGAVVGVWVAVFVSR